MKFAARVERIGASPTLTAMQDAQALKASGVDVIDLGPGQPDFDSPSPVKLAGIEAIESNFTRYTAGSGISELRSAVAEFYNRKWGTEYDLSNVIISAGAKHVLYNVGMTLFEESDEVLIPLPYWVTFPEMVKLTGASPVAIQTGAEERFMLQTRAVKDALNPRVKGIIVNTPNNPTGAVLPTETVEWLVSVGRKEGVFLLFDETYDYFTYGDAVHTSLARFVKPEDDFYAIVGSFSKTYAMTGWRVGYCVGPKKLIKKLGEFQSHQSGNTCSVSQKAALAALELEPACLEEMREEYDWRRRYVLDRMERIEGFECPRPDGAFYVFPRVSEAMDRLNCRTSAEFSKVLLHEAHVATVPGSAFGMEGHIRLSYATSRSALETGFDRIEALLRRGR